jgi:hypothetical protein
VVLFFILAWGHTTWAIRDQTYSLIQARRPAQYALHAGSLSVATLGGALVAIVTRISDCEHSSAQCCRADSLAPRLSERPSAASGLVNWP